LNSFGFFCALAGLLIGTFFGIKNLIQIFALNDTVQTWNFNTNTLGDYTYDSTLIKGRSDYITGGLKKVSNGSFEENTDGWSGIQSYILDDEFSDTQPTTLVSGTSTLSNGGVITPTVGSELVVDGGFEDWTSATDLTNWVEDISGSSTVNRESTIKHSGNYSTRIDVDSIASWIRISQVSSDGGIEGKWYVVTGWMRSSVQNSIGVFHMSNSNGKGRPLSNTTWNQYTDTFRGVTGANFGFKRSSSSTSIYADDISVKSFLLPSLFSTKETSSKIVTASAGITVADGTQAGIVTNLDSQNNPQNFVVAYYDAKDGAYAYLEKVVNGVYTTLIKASVSYQAGAVIKLVRNSEGYSLFYNGAQVGTTQTITDAGIINNTIHGLFSTYATNSFTNFEIKSSIDGTPATPILAGNGSATRTVRDTFGYITLGSGLASFSTGTTASGRDPGLRYPTIDRTAGRVLTARISTPTTESQVYFGGIKTSNYAEGGTIALNRLQIKYAYNNTFPGISVANSTAGTMYQVLRVLRSAGEYIYIKGGEYSNWTLMWIDSRNTVTSFDPIISNYSTASFQSDYIRIPDELYMPEPLAYDTFTRTNGPIGDTETTGPDNQSIESKQWEIGTWNTASSKAINNTILGNDIVINGTMEGTYLNGVAPSWTSTRGNTASSTDKYGGTLAQQITNPAGNSGVVNQNIGLTIGNFYCLSFYGKVYKGIGGHVNDASGIYFSGINITSSSWTKYNTCFRATTENVNIAVYAETNATNDTNGVLVDSFSLKLMSLASLFSTIHTNTPAIIASANLTIPVSKTSTGIVTNLDSYEDPKNFLIAYHDGSNIHLDKAIYSDAPETNLLANPGLETAGGALFQSWNSSLISGQGSLEIETSSVHSGNQAIKITGDTTVSYYPRIYQVVDVTPGETYTLSFWTRGDGLNSGRVQIWNTANNTQLYPYTSTGVTSTEYKKYAITFTVPSDCTVINININSANINGAVVYYDDLSLEAVPDITYTSLINTAATYVANAPLTVSTDNSTSGHLKVRVYYDNVPIGSEIDITDSTIINNTNHGLFSTYSGSSFDNFSLFAKGTSGEYSDLPAEDITATHETNIRYNGSGSSKLVSGGNNANYVQTTNIGDTNTYQVVTHAYTNGSQVTSDDLVLYYNNQELNTTYEATSVTGWYKLISTITGVNQETNIGVRVKANKTVYIDEFITYKTGLPYIYTTSAYSNPQVVAFDSFNATIQTPGDSTVTFQLCPNDGSTCETSSLWQYYNGTAWTPATNMSTHTNTKEQLTQEVMQSFPTNSKKISVKAILGVSDADIPTVSNISVGMTTDVIAPTSGSNPIFDIREETQCTYQDNCWTNQTGPQFSWNDGTDDNTGIRGYCLYLGTDEAGNPESSKGKLGTSPEPIGNTTCQFIVPNSEVDLSTEGYISSALSNSDTFVTAPNTYYLNIKAVDRADNVAEEGITIRFRYDGTKPTNVSYISTPSGNFSNVVDMSFTWTNTATDSESQILGYQYQLNSTENQWKGTTHSNTLNIDYIPTNLLSYTLQQAIDASSIISGNNVIYFRAIDNVGNPSIAVSGGISFGGQAPKFNGEDRVTITPSSSNTNNFAMSWQSATPSTGSQVSNYYYMVNTPPPSTLATLQSNSSTYMDNGTSTTVSTKSLPNVNKGSNTIYVVAIDNSATPNYSPSNYITGTFTLNSTNPDNVGNLIASDSSIKSQERWNVTLTFTEPTYKGAGNLTYEIMRSTNGTDYTQVGTTTGVSYVDNVPSSSSYYYKIYTKDGAHASSSGTNVVEITPTGRWTSSPELVTEPEAKNIATKKATINWTTERTSDSKVAFGTKSLEYFKEEPSNSDQVTGHTITISGLNPNTTYFYVAKWTDEDGNTGLSAEKSFQTSPAPTVKKVAVSNIGLSNAMIQFTSTEASKVKIYYGTSLAFGGVQEIYTSTQETKYTIQLSDLKDGTKYYYKINTFDSDLNEYEGTVLDFTTMPKPLISNVTLQEVKGTAQTTILVSWKTNTDISSIITYYPLDKKDQSLDQVNVKMISGKHEMQIQGLKPQTNYGLIVKGVDRIGNMAESDEQTFTTSTDTRSPEITNLIVQGQIVKSSDNPTAQLVISWNTDEPATSQVELGVGSGSSYTQKTQQDYNLTYNHTVVVSGLTPSTVYHLRGISIDSAGNKTNSTDTVTISPKATDNALDLVINNLVDIFGFLKR